jgi:hypothetical protein
MGSIRRKMLVGAGKNPDVMRLSYDRAYGVFWRAKKAMMRRFDTHAITQEINGGERAGNSSGTLGGYGNLFSYLGFDAGSRPTEALRQALYDGTIFQRTVYREGKFYFRVEPASKSLLSWASDMPWEPGNSWAFAVERGISNISHYMYNQYKQFPTSHSGPAIQVKGDYNSAPFVPKPYISEILELFRERINGNGSDF